jgi:hypothetical protein
MARSWYNLRKVSKNLVSWILDLAIGPHHLRNPNQRKVIAAELSQTHHF